MNVNGKYVMPAFFYQTTRGQRFRLLKEVVIWRDINKTESKLSNIVYTACAFGPYTTNKHCPLSLLASGCHPSSKPDDANGQPIYQCILNTVN